ncbi:MAG: hypothetical protein NTW60_03835 [Candidatus Wolfebacteria bacterium]|nr:hypothetical protein [Candidatus Wolfebacteria bacterium]
MSTKEEAKILTTEEIKGLPPEKVVDELVERRSRFVLSANTGQGASQKACDLAREVELLRQYIAKALGFYSLVETVLWECQCGAKGEVVHIGMSTYEVHHRIVWQHDERPRNCAGYRAKEPSVAAAAHT